VSAGDVLFAVVAVALGAGVGVVVGHRLGHRLGYRRGVAATWLTAVRALVWSTRVVHLQLARYERAAAEQDEQQRDTRYLPDSGPMPTNRAGYRSATNLNNSPSPALRKTSTERASR
jgi:hypothetical protein